jgi:hypothetical protein
MPLQATSGAATYDAFGGGAAAVPQYIEDVFSTYLTTGASANITVVNGIDLSGKGGLVWQKTRTSAGFNTLFDTVRGVNKYLVSNATNAEASASNILPTFNNNGFVIGTDNNLTTSGENGVSWTFREQPKFFDVVTYTGSGSGTQTIAHNLGSVPGCIITKLVSGGDTSGVGGWGVYHRSTGASQVLELNSTAAVATDNWYTTAPTSSNFYVFGNDPHSNRSGGTYVAYLFAHDAGGFGLTGTDNVISCGTFTTDGSGNATVNLGYEPQWLLIKSSSNADNWKIGDNMRGWTTSEFRTLLPNLSNAEGSSSNPLITSTGFQMVGDNASRTFIYIAIRRGPMKVPTVGTSVFSPVTRTGTGSAATVTGYGFPPDFVISQERNNYAGLGATWFDRLRGASPRLFSWGTNAEQANTNSITSYNMDGISVGTDSGGTINSNTNPYVYWNFRRAPSFFDEVCYTGTGSVTNYSHNLSAVPELMIMKKRSATGNWNVYSKTLGVTGNDVLFFNDDPAGSDGGVFWNSTVPTSSVFTLGTGANINGSGVTFVAYLFATCAGVSKVGSYTGTATTLQIDCGFTAGARFVLIKRTDSTGDWYVWDSARGIVSGNDPYLLLNGTAAEVTSTDYVDTYSAGFEISSTAPAAINASGGTFVFLAIA